MKVATFDTPTRTNGKAQRQAPPNELIKMLTPAMSIDELGIPNGLVTDLMYRLMFNEGCGQHRPVC